MSRWRSTHSVPPGTTDPASGTSRAATGSAGTVAPAVHAGAALASSVAKTTVNLPRIAPIGIDSAGFCHTREVIPAKAGIQDPEIEAVALDPHFRGGDHSRKM